MGDWNSDGKPDLLLGSKTNSTMYLFLELSLSSPPFALGVTSTFSGLDSCSALDANQDDRLDLVVSSFSGATSIFLAGASTPPAAPSFSVYTSPYSSAVTKGGHALVDLDHDGLLDLVNTVATAGGACATVSYGDAGLFSSRSAQLGATCSTTAPTTQVLLADMDADGNLDLLVVPLNLAAALPSAWTLNGTSIPLPGVPSGTYSGACVVDADGDGRVDIGLAETGGAAMLLLYNQSASAYATALSVAMSPLSCSILDLGDDARPELIFSSATQTKVVLPDPTLSKVVAVAVRAPPAGPPAVAALWTDPVTGTERRLALSLGARGSGTFVFPPSSVKADFIVSIQGYPDARRQGLAVAAGGSLQFSPCAPTNRADAVMASKPSVYFGFDELRGRAPLMCPGTVGNPPQRATVTPALNPANSSLPAAEPASRSIRSEVAVSYYPAAWPAGALSDMTAEASVMLSAGAPGVTLGPVLALYNDAPPGVDLAFEVSWLPSVPGRWVMVCTRVALSTRMSWTSSSVPYTPGSWVHLAVTFRENLPEMYVNGAAVTPPNPTRMSNDLAFGPALVKIGGVTGLTGYIDDVAVFGRGMSPGEIQSHYAGSLSYRRESDPTLCALSAAVLAYDSSTAPLDLTASYRPNVTLASSTVKVQLTLTAVNPLAALVVKGSFQQSQRVASGAAFRISLPPAAAQGIAVDCVPADGVSRTLTYWFFVSRARTAGAASLTEKFSIETSPGNPGAVGAQAFVTDTGNIPILNVNAAAALRTVQPIAHPDAGCFVTTDPAYASFGDTVKFVHVDDAGFPLAVGANIFYVLYTDGAGRIAKVSQLSLVRLPPAAISGVIFQSGAVVTLSGCTSADTFTCAYVSPVRAKAGAATVTLPLSSSNTVALSGIDANTLYSVEISLTVSFFPEGTVFSILSAVNARSSSPLRALVTRLSISSPAALPTLSPAFTSATTSYSISNLATVINSVVFVVTFSSLQSTLLFKGPYSSFRSISCVSRK